VPDFLEPESTHQVSVSFNNGADRTLSYTFTVQKYQNVTLPTPFYLETFDELTEDPTGPSPLPPGWTISNQTAPEGTDYDLDSRSSKSYQDWALISADRMAGWGSDRTAKPTILLNGSPLESLASGSLMWAESDSRCGGCYGQYQELYTADINCTGKTNVWLAWNSIYMQNQDNMDAVEYSIDGGATWLPALYLFCTQAAGEQSDIMYKDAAAGSIGTIIDAPATFNRTDNNRSWGPDPGAGPVVGAPYGTMIKAPISDALAPYIKPYINDSNVDGKRIEMVRLPQADGKATVRFRFLNTGTSAWFWGIDNVGLYEINTPVITTQPLPATVSYGDNATLRVVATGAGTLTYQWLLNNTPIPGATSDTLTLTSVTAANAGDYKVVVRNADGPVTSAPAKLTVIIAPEITTPPQPVLATVGAPINLSVAVRGKQPFIYKWQKNNQDIPGATSSTYSIPAGAAGDAGDYRVVVSNDAGVTTSASAKVTILPVTPITQDLVVHLPFDGNANDTSGKGNNGNGIGQPETGSIPPTYPTAGARIGTAAMHLAKGQYVNLGQPEDLNFGADVNFTFAYWVKGPAANAWSGDPSFIANKNWTDGGSPGLVEAAQGAGTFKENWKAASGPRRDSPAFGVLTDGTWHHVVISHDRTGLVYYYVDGSLKGTMSIANDGDINSLDYNIGQDGTGRYGFDNDEGAHFLDINFDDFGIWRRILSPQEVASIYSHGLNGEDLTKASGASAGGPGNVSVSLNGSQLTLSWAGDATTTLQHTSSLSPTNWQDVAGTTGASSATVQTTGTAGFYRLIKR